MSILCIFLDHCTKFISRIKCTILITFRYSEQVHCLRENKMPALKPTANDKLLFNKVLQSVEALLLMSISIKGTACTGF